MDKQPLRSSVPGGLLKCGDYYVVEDTPPEVRQGKGIIKPSKALIWVCYFSPSTRLSHLACHTNHVLC